MIHKTVDNPESPSRPDATANTQKPGIELLIGSNVFRNTNGVVKIQGKEQLVLESRHDGVYLTLDLYDQTGSRVAHIRRNTLVLNPTGQFSDDRLTSPDASTGWPWVRVVDHRARTPVLEAYLAADKKIQITMGRLYSHKGIAVEITPHYCRIGSGGARFGDITENRGGTVELD